MAHSRDPRNKPGIKRDFLKLPSSLEGDQCYCVTIPAGLDNKIALITLLRQATYWFNWDRSEGIEGKQAADRWSETLNLPELEMCCCPDVTNSYYDELGILQISTDGGITYTPDMSDPRFSSPLFPPLTSAAGDAKRCEAANNITGYVKSIADQIIADGTAWNNVTTLIAAIAAIIVLLLSAGTALALTPLLLGLVSALVGTGLAAFTAAMTEGVYSDLNCIVYCHCDNDGLFTIEDWQAIKGDIEDTFSGIVEKFLYDTINAMGLAGLNNASRAGVSAGQPCEECNCALDIIWGDVPGQLSAGEVIYLGASVWRITSGTRDFESNIHSVVGFQDSQARCFTVSDFQVVSGAISREYRELCAGGGGYGTIEGVSITSAAADRYGMSPGVQEFIIEITAALS